jgi:hypothetical protein
VHRDLELTLYNDEQEVENRSRKALMSRFCHFGPDTGVTVISCNRTLSLAVADEVRIVQPTQLPQWVALLSCVCVCVCESERCAVWISAGAQAFLRILDVFLSTCTQIPSLTRDDSRFLSHSWHFSHPVIVPWALELLTRKKERKKEKKERKKETNCSLRLYNFVPSLIETLATLKRPPTPLERVFFPGC